MSAHPKRKGPSAEREQDEVDLLRLNDNDPDLYPARAAKELVAHIVRAQVSVCIDRARSDKLSNPSEERNLDGALANAALWAAELIDIPAEEIRDRLARAVIEVAGEPAKRTRAMSAG